MTYQSRNSIRVTPARHHQPHPELEVSQVTFSVRGQSQRDDRDNVSCLRPVVDEDGRRHVTLSFSCADEDRPNVIVESCNSLGVDVHQQNTSSVSLITNHTTASRSSPGHHLPSSTGRSRVDFIDKSDAVDLPFVSTSQEIQNPPFGDNKLSRVNNTGKPCEHLTTEQTHIGLGVAEYCVLQTHDQDVHTNAFSSHAKASASCRLHSASDESIGHKNTQPVHHRRANLSPQFKTRTIIKPFPVYGSTGTEITHLSCTPPTNRDNVNRVGFSPPSRNVETKCWVASGQSKDNNSSESEYTVSSLPIQVSIGGLGLQQCEESVFEDSRENITGYNETRLESKQLRVPTVLTITPSSSKPKVRELGDHSKTLTFVKELDKGANNVGITELRISSSCASRSLGDRSLHNMDSTNNNPRDGSNLVNCMDDSGQNQDNHGLQASRIFKPIKPDDSVSRCEVNDTRLSAPERPVSSSSSAPTTPSFPKPFVPHGYDIARQQFSQHDRNSSPQGIGSRAEEVSSMARSTYKNSNSKSGQQIEISGTSGRLGFGTITTVASLKPLGVTKLAKVSKKSLQSFDDFTPTSSPTASRRSSVSSQDLSDATNEVKVLLARDVSVGDTAGHTVRVSAVQLPRKTTLNLRQSSVETDTRVSPMENSKKLFLGSETGEMKNLVGLRTDFSEFRLQGARVSPRNSPKSFIRTHTISAPSSPVRSLQDLTMKMKETPSASPLLSPRDKRPFSPMSEPAEDQGCVPDIQDELEHPGCSQTLPRNFHRRRPKTAPSVPTALLREVSNVGKELKDRVSTSTHRDASSPLKFSFQPINVKIKEDTESDSDRTILSHAKSKSISVKKRKKPSYSGQSTDSSESNGESNGRSRSDPTQDRKRSGETGEAVFENLQESQKGHSSSSIVSAESALSISSINTTLSDPNGEETFTDAYEEVLRETDGPIADSLDQAKNVGKSQFKQKSLTWPNGEKSENELAEYCADKINMASSAPEVSGIEDKAPDDSSQHPKSRSPVLMPKQKSLTDSPKRTDSFSDSSMDSVRHKRSTSEPAPVDLSKSRADSGSDRQLPTLTVTTSQELGPTQRRFERKKPIIGSVPANQFLQPEPLEDQPSTTGSTPDLSHNSKNSRLESLMNSRSSATLPRAAASSKVEELSPKTKQKRKKENLKQHVMTTLLETEKSYVQCLESLIKRYQRPLKSAEFTGICDAGIVDSIFYKIPEILQNHENFLQQLEMGIENKHTVQKIANLITNSFSKQPVLDAYTAFTNNFDHAKELIGKASQKLGFIRFLEERTKEHKERLHIDDLIIQPVQRIPRYELLLKDLIDNTPPDHEDFESLNMALDTVRKLATAVDESKNLADNARKDEQALKELEGLIDGVDLVSPHRKFVRQYAITEMKGGKKERCLFLFSDMIICASVKRRSGGLRRPSVTVLLPIEASKYKLAWKVHIEDVEILKSTPNAKRANQERDLSRLEEDLAILNRISGLSDTLNCTHVVLDDAVKELIDSVSKKISEHQALASLPISPLNKVELSVTSPEGIDTFIIFFHNTESRVSFENEVADAKKKLDRTVDHINGCDFMWSQRMLLINKDVTQWEIPCLIESQPHKYAASSRNHFPPVFLDAIPIMKTRSGMQFSCASPSLGTINDSLREVWVCNSDGYVGQVCLLNLNPEPTVAFCISLCSARILCIAAVPGTQEHPNGRGKLRVTNSSFQSIKPSPPVKPASFRPVNMGNSTEATEIMAFDSDDSEDEEMKLPDEMANNVELNVLAVEESAKDSDGEDFDDRDTHLEESQSDFEVYQPTMWLGTEDCCIHVYQCTDNLRTKKSRAKIRHPAAVHCILYLDNKVFVALANGDLTVYKRELGQGWDTTNPMTVTLGSSTTPITRMVAVRGKLWCGCQNNILVVDPNNLNIQHQFAVCSDNQRAVYCMVSSGWGVWVSLQSSAVVRLFHATTYESLCNVDVTQTVQKMLAGSDAIIRQHKAACLRITALLVCRDLLWMGTSAGVVLTLPMPKLGLSSTALKESPTVTGSNQGHTGHVRFLTFVDLNNAFSNNNNASKRITLPNMGERTNDALTEGAVTNHEDRRKSGSSDMLVISGGDGYEDFGATTPNELAGKEDSTNHLLLWQV